jgi:hypothetical protein
MRLLHLPTDSSENDADKSPAFPLLMVCLALAIQSVLR